VLYRIIITMEINTLFQMLLLLGCFKGYTSDVSQTSTLDKDVNTARVSQTSTLDKDVCSVDSNTSTCTPPTKSSVSARPSTLRRSKASPRSPSEVCYDHLGCFSNLEPYTNANGELPISPEEQGVEHMIYSMNNKVDPEYVKYQDVNSVKNLANVNPRLPLKIVIHGFKSTVKTGWAQDIKDAILEIEDVNVYLVDWSGGAGSVSDLMSIYDQATANTRVVAAQVAKVVQQFHAEGLSLDDVHLIGHSLGAHTCGEVGKLLNGKVGRITGLDPASPGYEDLDAIVRLDATDALYVDAIHTDGREEDRSIEQRVVCGGLGTMQTSGHLDVYVNGGEGQPGCVLEGHDSLCNWPKGFRTVEEVSPKLRSDHTMYCSHTRVSKLFVESIASNPCTFKIQKCDSYELFQQGRCLKCPKAGCDVLGYHNKGTQRGLAYLDTRESKLFCGFHYFLNITPKSEAEGTVRIKVTGTKGTFTHSYESTVEDRNEIALPKLDIGDIQTRNRANYKLVRV